MMRCLLMTLSLLFVVIVKAQTNYNYNSIPDSLKENADYIVWEDKMDFEILDKGKALKKVKYAVCITDQYSREFNTIYAHYNKNEKVTDFKAKIYNEIGKLVKYLKKNEIKDISAVSSFSLFEDDRVMIADFTHNTYPYTLVFEYEKKVDGLLNFPDWYFQSLSNMGVISSEIRIIVPENYKFRYKEYNFSQKVKIINTDRKKVYSWKEQNLKPLERKELAPPMTYYKPMLLLAPVSFSEGGFANRMDSWGNFGKWNWDLNKGRDNLPAATKTKIKELIKNAKSDKEKVKILYEYMQNKTRYVSVQLGIGGYQTFPAEYVDTKGYGDCKALSNYMYAMLKEVGIKSHYTLVNAGRNEDDIVADFPSNQFNHVILCVPFEKDTVWLECTSQQQPFNFLGSFTNDRHALLVTENGGKLVKTPRYGKEVNTLYRNVDIKIDAEGHAEVKAKTSFSGLQYENRKGLLDESVKEQNDAIKEDYGISGMEINSLKFTEYKNEIPTIEEDLDLTIMRFASTSSKRMFIKLNVFNESTYVPKNEERLIPFKLNYEFTDVDSVSFEIPKGYKVENKPKEINQDTKFGAYSIKVIRDGNKILYIRKRTSEKGIFPASDYRAYYEYRKKIKRADKAKLVLVKAT